MLLVRRGEGFAGAGGRETLIGFRGWLNEGRHLLPVRSGRRGRFCHWTVGAEKAKARN